MAYPWVIRAFIFLRRFGCSEMPLPLASGRELFSRRQFSRYVAPCWLARAAGQSPPAAFTADRPARLRQSLPQPGSPRAGVCYNYSAQPSIAEAGLSPASMSKIEGCTAGHNSPDALIVRPFGLAFIWAHIYMGSTLVSFVSFSLSPLRRILSCALAATAPEMADGAWMPHSHFARHENRRAIISSSRGNPASGAIPVGVRDIYPPTLPARQCSKCRPASGRPWRRISGGSWEPPLPVATTNASALFSWVHPVCSLALPKITPGATSSQRPKPLESQGCAKGRADDVYASTLITRSNIIARRTTHAFSVAGCFC